MFDWKEACQVRFQIAEAPSQPPPSKSCLHTVLVSFLSAIIGPRAQKCSYFVNKISALAKSPSCAPACFGLTTVHMFVNQNNSKLTDSCNQLTATPPFLHIRTSEDSSEVKRGIVKMSCKRLSKKVKNKRTSQRRKLKELCTRWKPESQTPLKCFLWSD